MTPRPRYILPDRRLGHVFHLHDDGATLLASPMLSDGTADLDEVVEVDWSRGVDATDLPAVARIAATLRSRWHADDLDPGGHVRVVPAGGGSRADRPLLDQEGNA